MNREKKLFILLACAPIIVLLFFLFRFSVNFPFWDEWEIPTLIQKISTNNLHISDLFAQHNEHRLFFPRIIILMNFYLTRWNLRYEIGVSFLLALVIFFTSVLFLVKIESRMKTKSIYKFIPLLSALIFSLNQFENWFIGWQLQIFLNVVAVMLGIFFLTRKAKNKKLDLIFGIIFGIVATFSFANGLIFWFIGGFVILFTPCFKNLKTFIIWLAVSAFMFLIYFHNYSKPIESPSLSAPISSFLNYIQYVLVYIGGPFGVNNRIRALIFGLINCGSFIYLLKRLNGKIKVTVLVPIISIWIYAFLSAFITGIGRFGFGEMQTVTSRYITISNLAWISLTLLIYVYLEKYIKKKRRIFVILLMYLIIGGATLLSFRFNIHLIVDHYNRINYAKSQILCKKAITDETYKLLYPNAKIVKTKIEMLKTYNLSFLQDKCIVFLPRLR